MDLRLDFAATNRRLAGVGLTSNMFVNKHSDFLALGFLLVLMAYVHWYCYLFT